MSQARSDGSAVSEQKLIQGESSVSDTSGRVAWYKLLRDIAEKYHV